MGWPAMDRTVTPGVRRDVGLTLHLSEVSGVSNSETHTRHFINATDT